MQDFWHSRVSLPPSSVKYRSQYEDDVDHCNAGNNPPNDQQKGKYSLE